MKGGALQARRMCGCVSGDEQERESDFNFKHIIQLSNQPTKIQLPQNENENKTAVQTQQIGWVGWISKYDPYEGRRHSERSHSDRTL